MQNYFFSQSLNFNGLSHMPLSKSGEKEEKTTKKNDSCIIAVTSGKGGVGKTNFVVNIALELGLQGFPVTLLDADLALANVDLLLGVNPTYNIGHVVSGQRSLKEIIFPLTPKVNLIAASSGLDQLARLGQNKRNEIINDLQEIEQNSKFILVDTAAGVGSNVINFLSIASEVIVVTMPEPTAIIDAYATIKVLHKNSPKKRIWLVVNNVDCFSEAEEVFNQLEKTCNYFLKHKINYLGAIPRDTELIKAVKEQIPVTEYCPTVPSSRAFKLIAKRLYLSLGLNRAENELPLWHSLIETEFPS